MPVDERTFAAEIAGWVTDYLNDNPDLPFNRATVEKHVEGSALRHDFCLYSRRTNQPVLTGEIKMPDSVQGRHPLNGDLVDDALHKASREGVRYCFTWNVRQFILFDSHIQGVPYTQRHIEGPSNVAEVRVSDDVNRQWVRDSIREYWKQFLYRFGELLAGRRSFEPAPIDQRFIAWLEAALEDPIINTMDALLEQSGNSLDFKGRMDSWMLSQGWEPSSQREQQMQNLERVSRLSCYILVTRLVFYQVLRRRFNQMSAISLQGVESPEQLQETLEARFEEAVRYSRDYETVFRPDEKDFGYSIPFLSPTAPNDWRRLIRRIEDFDFSTLDFEVIGQMYESLISPNERRRFGQFYTSPDVVDLINAFCIRSAEDHVLDPACGGGTFLVRAYYRKRKLAGIAEDTPTSHEQLLNQLFGVDISAFPAQLSTINLAVRHLSDQGNYPLVARANFFDAQAGIQLYDIPLSGDSKRNVALGEVDAVVGNPPYIRQEGINQSEKKRYGKLFQAEWPAQTSLSGRSDIYAYFFSHGAHFLKPGGYLGFVTSIGWLDTDYGFKIQEFFLRNFRIVAVIESQVEKWFEDARVTTAVTILQRETDEVQRNNNIVRFIQLREPLVEVLSQALDQKVTGKENNTQEKDWEALRDIIEDLDKPTTTDYWRVRFRTQRQLWEDGLTANEQEREGEEIKEPPQYGGGKWGQYVRGPESWFELTELVGDRMTPLRNLANITRGFTSGADRFYCVRDVTQKHLDATPDPQGFMNRWGIARGDTRRIRIVRDGDGVEHLVEKRFLEPELHSLMEVKRAEVRSEDVSRMVINASQPRARIAKTHLGAYVDFAERNGWDTGSTIKSRARTRPWYDLGLKAKEQRADLFWPMSQQYRHVVPLNIDLLPANHNLFELWAIDQEQKDVLWAALNSTVTALSKHQFGRAAGVEGNLKTEVVDAKMMLVPDIRRADPETAARAVAACRRISQRDSLQYLYQEFKLEDRRELDDAVLEMLGIEDPESRAMVRESLYQDITKIQRSTRDREIIAQEDRKQANRTTTYSPQDIADELWSENHYSFDLQQFPEDFVARFNAGELIDLPPGEVQVGTAMIQQENLLKAGTVRVGGVGGEILDVGTVARSRFLEALSACRRSGTVRLPDDATCEDAVISFNQYRKELEEKCLQLAQQKTPDQQRQRSVANALLRKALQWTRE